VDRPGEQTFAGSRFALEKDRRYPAAGLEAWRHALEILEDRPY